MRRALASAYAAEGDAVVRSLELRRQRAPRVHALVDEAQEASNNATDPEAARAIEQLLFVVQEVAAAGSEVTAESAEWFRRELEKVREQR